MPVLPPGRYSLQLALDDGGGEAVQQFNCCGALRGNSSKVETAEQQHLNTWTRSSASCRVAVSHTFMNRQPGGKPVTKESSCSRRATSLLQPTQKQPVQLITSSTLWCATYTPEKRCLDAIIGRKFHQTAMEAAALPHEVVPLFYGAVLRLLRLCQFAKRSNWQLGRSARGGELVPTTPKSCNV